MTSFKVERKFILLMKNKKLLLVAAATMGFVALGAAGVGTAAWFTVTNAATLTQDAASASFTAADTQHALDGITVVLGISGTTSTKLSANNGKYKVWNKDHSVLTPYDIESVTGFYSEMTVSVTKIYLTSDSSSKTALTPSQLIPFAGTYGTFTVTTSGQLAGGDAAPSSVSDLNAFTIGAIDTFTLTISTEGGVSLSDSTFAVAMRGNDEVNDGSETGSVTITYGA